MLNVKIIKLKPDAVMPQYKKPGDAGADLASTEYNVIKPGQAKLISTGICIALPAGYEAQIRPRSGLALKNCISVLNTPGTIDSSYRGEVGVILINHSSEDFVVNPGDRIAQMVIAKHENAEFELVETLDETERGSGRFGHTGIK